jgi:hypothetical protein
MARKGRTRSGDGRRGELHGSEDVGDTGDAEGAKGGQIPQAGRRARLVRPVMPSGESPDSDSNAMSVCRSRDNRLRLQSDGRLLDVENAWQTCDPHL